MAAKMIYCLFDVKSFDSVTLMLQELQVPQDNHMLTLIVFNQCQPTTLHPLRCFSLQRRGSYRLSDPSQESMVSSPICTILGISPLFIP